MLVRAGSSLAALGVFVIGGCVSTEPVDLGHDKPEALGAALSDYEGSWDGYAEAFVFDDGTDRVHLELGPDGTGILQVGNAEPLAAPDADHGYPPSAENIYDGVPESEALISGFDYPVTDGSVSANRLRMRSNSRELYREWCELQTPHLVTNAAPTYWACLPTAGYSTSQDENGDTVCTVGDNDEIEIDCSKPLCLSTCTCTEDSCGLGGVQAESNVVIDAALEGDGDTFTGTLALGASEGQPAGAVRLIVHLVRE